MPDSAARTESIHDTDALKAIIAERDTEIAQLRRRMETEGALRDAGAIDLEAANALLERDQGASGDIAARIADLRQRKPFLFEPPRRNASALGPKPESGPTREIERAAQEAASTGRRTDLLRYLRLRRKRE